MNKLRPSFGHFPTGTSLQPLGWLKRQLHIQAEGLAGNLDTIWPDVRDSAWIGGTAEGWERVPYWLDGFIDLAWMLNDTGLQKRAKRYIDAIFARQCPDGWICPCPEEKRASYDVWSLFLLSKVLIVWERRTGDERTLPALLKAFRQLQQHVKEHPLKGWGKFRWYESLLALSWLYEKTGEAWIPELVETIRSQSFHYPDLVAQWPFKQPESAWTLEGHVVNLAMALHSELLYQKFHPESSTNGDAMAEDLFQQLQTYHSMATGHFTGDECLGGDSPSRGSELCSVVEAMFSDELLLAETGHAIWGDRLEKLAFNALPAACSPDMWTHQYDQQTNQIGCQQEIHPIWTNAPTSHWFGLEPNFGCCTANFGQGWPKFAASAMLLQEKTIISAISVPCELKTTIDNANVRCRVDTAYPFRDDVDYTISVDKPVDFTFKFRVPGFAVSAELDGVPVAAGTFHEISRHWEGSSRLHLTLHFTPRLTERPRGLFALWRGPLLFSLPLPYDSIRHEYTANHVERRFPYCDYELFATEPWNFGFASDTFTFQQHELSDSCPFSDREPPLSISTTMKSVPWKLYENTFGIAATSPSEGEIGQDAVVKTMIPYGCTMLRMTEMPFVKDKERL